MLRAGEGFGEQIKPKRRTKRENNSKAQRASSGEISGAACASFALLRFFHRRLFTEGHRGLSKQFNVAE